MLGKLFSAFKKGSAPTVATKVKISTAVSDSIYSVVGARSIPPMAGNAQKAFKLATDPKSDARDFIELIKADESMSARILRVANSVYFDRGKTSKSIEEAVQVIGLNELRLLLNASSLSSLFPSTHPARALAWDNDIATAVVAKFLADRCNQELSTTAFLGGLMHDIGKLLLIQRSSEDYQKILRKVEQEGMHFHEAESLIFPFDHTEVGLLIAERWSFSDDLKVAIRNHHQPFSSLGHMSLAGIIKSADILSYGLGLVASCPSRLRVAMEKQIPDVWQYLDISIDRQPEMTKSVKRFFESEIDLYRTPPS